MSTLALHGTVPFTLDGREIPPDAPGAMLPEDVETQIADAAQNLRDVALHCHYDLTDRDLTVYAANVYGETVVFNFGDRSAEISVPVDGGQASATHTYATDGVYALGVNNGTERWFTEVAVNWPQPPTPPEAPA
jgi:hypothetical protein